MGENHCYFIFFVQSEYGEIVHASKTSTGIYEIYDVWNKSETETVPEKYGEYISSLLTDDNITLSVSRGFSKKFKENFPNHKQKHNMSINLRLEVNTKNIDYFMVDKKQVLWYDSKPSADEKKIA